MNTVNLAVTKKVKKHIESLWHDLKRDRRHLLVALNDPKLPEAHNTKNLLYISPEEKKEAVLADLRETLSKEDWQQVQIKVLPRQQVKWHGLLYLPHPYVVPGGRYNEMYGWDSYFIILGLLQDGHIHLAKNMFENMVYEIFHYGKVLNANRTYSLDRSQPPLLTRMAFALFEKTADSRFLFQHLDAFLKCHAFWDSQPHKIDIGLSRYYVSKSTPAIEVENSELDENGLNHYQRVINYYRTHAVHEYHLEHFYDAKHMQLKPAFYRADRAMRESGFDPSSKFGMFSADVLNYAPACLNSLVYQMEVDIAEIYHLLSQEELSQTWYQKAQARASAINHYCWNQDLGYYFDYHIRNRHTRPYLFATTFYPLWAGVASPYQAERLVKNLAVLEASGGLLTSAYVTGDQWDAPFGWAPLHYFTIKGLLRYGYTSHAERLAYKFIDLVNGEFVRTGHIFEKYNVWQKTADVSKDLKYGYQSNEIGFGWTNGVYQELLTLFNIL